MLSRSYLAQIINYSN